LKTVIVYLAHTQERILNDAVFSILNLVHSGLLDTDAEVIVGTDKPDFFHHLPVKVWPLSVDQIEEWKGDIGFIHRTKPVFLTMVTAEHPNCNILYFDADTAISCKLTELLSWLDAGKALLHASEGTVETSKMPVYKPIRKLIDSGKLDLPDLASCVMYNAGVIGIPRTNVSDLDDVISAVDKYYPLIKNHIVEQMMFSYYTSARHQIVDTSDVIEHWWGKGTNTGPIISQCLKETKTLSLDVRAKRAAELMTMIKAAPLNPRLSFTERLKRSIRKRIG
jgi:hypothetical protein